MKIVFVSSELVPFAKTGGLADMTGTLAAEVSRQGHEVIAFLPRYGDIDIKNQKLELEIGELKVPFSGEKEIARVYSHLLGSGLKVYFIDHQDFFSREGYYGTPMGDFADNDRRFTFFQRAVLEAIRKLKFKADVIHCHDWQTGLIPVYLKSVYKKDVILSKAKSIFTIHNLAYQGNFPPDSLPTTGLGWEQFTMERLEFYGKVSFMKGGILDADTVTTVSKKYAEEIRTKEFGCGLENVIDSRADSLVGIVNGIDPKEWDPAMDTELVENYDAASVEKKKKNKAALQKENRFKDSETAPIIGLVSRLVDQKGIDIIIPSIPEIVKMGAQFVLLGTGDEKYHRLLRQIGKKYHDECGIHIVFDLDMAKRIYAGADMVLLPSYYEPCGLGQMIALRYGTVPIVRNVGGLADTIEEFSVKDKTGNGFVFSDYTSEALVETVSRAIKAYKNPEDWSQLIQNAMSSDYTWEASAKEYIQLYETMKKRGAKA